VRRAASQRFPSALLQMGLFFMNGWCGFQQSDEKAIACFRLAEKVRQPQAIFYLGNMYEQGRGVFRSLKIAKQKYIIAEQLGVSEAKDRLARILFSEEQQKLDNRRYCQIVGNHLYDVFQTIRECIDRAYSGCRNELKLANMAKI
jgi:TPR repeat protein